MEFVDGSPAWLLFHARRTAQCIFERRFADPSPLADRQILSEIGALEVFADPVGYIKKTRTAEKKSRANGSDEKKDESKIVLKEHQRVAVIGKLIEFLDSQDEMKIATAAMVCFTCGVLSSDLSGNERVQLTGIEGGRHPLIDRLRRIYRSRHLMCQDSECGIHKCKNREHRDSRWRRIPGFVEIAVVMGLAALERRETPIESDTIFRVRFEIDDARFPGIMELLPWIFKRKGKKGRDAEAAMLGISLMSSLTPPWMRHRLTRVLNMRFPALSHCAKTEKCGHARCSLRSCSLRYLIVNSRSRQSPPSPEPPEDTGSKDSSPEKPDQPRLRLIA